MDRPNGQQETVFCHECEHEWVRDTHGLTCPQCHSSFTEIIEDGHDPRDEYTDDVNHLTEHQQFDPLDYPDPEEEDINGVHFTRQPGHEVPPHDFYGHPSSGQGDFGYAGHNASNVPANGGQTAVANNFASMISNMMGLAAQPANPAQTTMFPGGQRTTRTYNLGNSRITYMSSSYTTGFPPPRDVNNHQPGAQPVEDLHRYAPLTEWEHPLELLTQNSVLTQLLSGLQGPAGPRGMAEPGMPPPNPLSSLFSVLFNPAGAQHGDTVFTQEAFDRVVSQLMDQNGMGNAPGPASQDEIATLPKRHIDKSMLGENGKAECSICMDEVLLGDEVTQLYCSHWFHGPCVAAWLQEHDTCPHCRKSIKQAKEEFFTRQNVEHAGSASPRAPSRRRSSGPSTHRRPSNPDGGGSSSSGGIGDRFKSFFGRS